MKNNDTRVAFKNYAPFSTCKTEINYIFIDEANHIYITIPSDNYSDTLESLWQIKIDEARADNVDLDVNYDNFNSQSFKYKTALVGKTKDVFNVTINYVKYTKIIVPLKYLSNFWRSLEMPLINCKIPLELNQIEDCILSSDGDSVKFKITDAKLHVPIVPLSTKDNINLTKQLSDGFKRSVDWKKNINYSCKSNK